MRNRYPGPCYRCGQLVAAGDGHFERHLGKWRTQHAGCAIRYRGTDQSHLLETITRMKTETANPPQPTHERTQP